MHDLIYQTMGRQFSCIILLLSIVFSVFCQQDTLNRIDNKGQKQGYWKKFNQNHLVYEGHFKNNIPIGEFKYYHQNGNLKSISVFINGPLKVKTTLFHDNGKKSAEGLFLNQIKDSIWNYYSESGILIKTESYNKGEKHGTWKTYSAKTGILLEEINYDQNLLSGVFKEYYVNGDIQTVIHYINGKRNGITESYFADSILSISGIYHNDFKIGTWKYFDYNGILRKEITFNRSEPQEIFLVLYNGSSAQPVSQKSIAYFQKTGNKTKVVMQNGKIFLTTDELSTLRDFLDFVDFTPVTPNIIAANEAIKGYQVIDENRISVFIEPVPEFEIFSEGAEAQAVKMLFDRSPIKEE